MGKKSTCMRTAAVVALGLITTLLVTITRAEAAPTRYEAENATISQGVVESNHLGFSGTGFVNYNNLVGSYVQWSVNAPAAGTATIGLRYSNGTTTNRPMDITVNGALVSDELAFGSTANWDTWATKTITAPVNAGSNTIRATATTANGGPNVDRLRASLAGDTESPTIPGQPSCSNIGETSLTLSWGACTGFVNYANEVGSYVEWTVSAATDATVNFEIRYSNGTTTNRPMDITVNGSLVRDELAFNSTTNWDTWQNATFTAPLNAGANTIRATATTANGGPNVDRLRASLAGDTESPTIPGQPSCSNIGETSLTLSWGASTDNVGVVAYDIYHDGNKLSEAPGTDTSKNLTGLTANTEYRLSVFARDAAGGTPCWP